MLVVDASILAPALADAGHDGQTLRHRLRDETVVAPDLLRIEVSSVLRRHAASGHLTPEQADAAISDLLAFPIRVFPTAPLLRRVWELRHNLTAYDGCYIALAEAVGCPLLTADRRLANAPGLRCTVELPDIEAIAEEVATTDYATDLLKRRARGRPLLGSAPAEVVPVRLEPDLRAAVEARAEADETNSSEVIRRALRAYLDVA